MMDISNIGFDDIAKKAELAHSLAEEVIVIDREYLMAKHILNSENMPPIRLSDTVATVLCKYGKVSFRVNYNTCHLTKGSAIMLTSRHIIDNIRIDTNCSVVGLVLSQNFVRFCVQDSPIFKKMLEVSNNAFNRQPILQLEDDQMRNLIDIIMRIKNYLKMPDHTFQSQMVKNETCNFIFEFTHILLQILNADTGKTEKESRKDEVMREFVQLLVKHHKKEHEVAFYAKELCMTTTNLSRTITAVSRKSPIHWIGEALISEAKILLRKPDATVKEVAEELHFGDQSSFGKFFKKHTGTTPVEYRHEGI